MGLEGVAEGDGEMVDLQREWCLPLPAAGKREVTHSAPQCVSLYESVSSKHLFH